MTVAVDPQIFDQYRTIFKEMSYIFGVFNEIGYHIPTPVDIPHFASEGPDFFNCRCGYWYCTIFSAQISRLFPGLYRICEKLPEESKMGVFLIVSFALQNLETCDPHAWTIDCVDSIEAGLKIDGSS